MVPQCMGWSEKVQNFADAIYGWSFSACWLPNECHCTTDQVDPKGICGHKIITKTKNLADIINQYVTAKRIYH